jgi:tellurite resistance protein TerC
MIFLWVGFIGLILALLALDLGVFHRRAHAVSLREAFFWSVIWITCGLLFSKFVYFGYQNHWFGLGTTPDPVDRAMNTGTTAALKYLTGFVVEKSLSADNIFVIAMIFNFFGVPPIYRHRVLFWGIVGALVLRGVMIAIGATLVARFTWILLIFGVFLIVTGIKMLFLNAEDVDPNKNAAVRLARRLFPVTSRFHGQHFLVRAGTKASHEGALPGEEDVRDEAVEGAKPGTLLLTPLAIALVTVETSDVIFAVDSIPAIFAITGDPFLVFTSNVFAILGLRALFFVLSGMIEKFRYLKASLSLVLVLIGVKMLVAKKLHHLLGEHFHVIVLAVVLSILAAGVLFSMVHGKKRTRA